MIYMDRTNIIIANYAGVNTGDDAIFICIFKEIKEVLGTEIFLMADNDLSLKSKYPIEDSVRIFDFYKISNWKKINKFLKKSRLVIYGGGDIVNENFTSISFLNLAKLLGLPLVVWGVGVVPINSFLLRYNMQRVLNQAEIILVRDQISKDLLNNMGVVKPQVKVINDLALFLNPNSKNNHLINDLKDIPTRTLKIGLNIRNFDDLYSSHSKWSEEDLLLGTAKICDYFVDKFDAHIICLPMVIRERSVNYHPNLTTDDQLMEKLIPLMENPDKILTLKGDYAPEDLLGLINKLDLIVAMRLHTLILGANAGVPLLAFNYAPKVGSFMSSIELSDCVLNMESITNREKITETLDVLDDIITRINKGNYNIGLKKYEYDNKAFKNLVRNSLKNRPQVGWRIHFFIPLMVIVSAMNYLYQTIILIKQVKNGLK